MGEPLIEAAVNYAESGHRVFPLWGVRPDGSCQCPHAGCASPGKHPHRLAPKGLNNATDDVQVVESWWRTAPTCNIGLCTGETFFVVDCDKHENVDGTALFLQMAEEHGGLPETATVDTGGGGAHFLFAMEPDVDVRNQQGLRIGSDRVHGIDVRGTGGYIVAPPSLHASGKRYQWSRDLEHLKAAPFWMLQLVGQPVHEILPTRIPRDLAGSSPAEPPQVAARAPRGSTPKTPAAPREVSESDTQQITTALKLIPPNTDRQTWVEHVTMPLHDLFCGSEEGFTIWHAWCATGANLTTPNGNPAYENEKACRRIWRSFDTRHRNPKGPATFWQLAIKHGWVGFPPPGSGSGSSLNGAPPFVSPPQFCAEEIAESLAGPSNPGPFPPSVVMNLEGPLKDMIDWIVAASRRPDQTIALAAALAVVAAAVGRRATGPGGSRCMLTMAMLAPSGAGKDKPQECVKNLLSMHPNLSVGLFDDSPTHRTQLDELLLVNKGQALMLVDEYGSTLKRWLDHRDSANSSMSPVIRRLAVHGMNTYQLAVVSRKHPSRVKHGAAWDAGIFAPSFSLVGFSTPGQFYGALSESSLVDGFLGRHIIIASRSTEYLRAPLASSMEPPETVTQWLKTIEELPVPTVKPADVFQPATGFTARVDPMDIPWESTAVDSAWTAMSRTIDEAGTRATVDEQDAAGAILRRLQGQIITLAMIFACGEVHDIRDAVIAERHLDLAYRVAKWSGDNLMWRLRMGIAVDDFGKAHKYACERIESIAPKKLYLSYLIKRSATASHAMRIWALLKEDPRFLVEGKAVRLRASKPKDDK